MAVFEILFLGTGAADYPWNGPLSSEIRGSCSTLLNGHILIDAGVTGIWNLNRCRIPFAQITDILITHSHDDHFNSEQIDRIANTADRSEPLNVYASPEALAQLSGNIRKHPLHWGDRFEINGLKVLVTPSNHLVLPIEEDTFHFLFESNGKRLYYALDGGWMSSRERFLFEKKTLDMIIWDSTCGNTFNDWRFAEHNDLNMVRNMICSMFGAGLVRKDTVHVFDHVAMTLWPKDEKDKVKLAEEFGGILAFDGMKLSL